VNFSARNPRQDMGARLRLMTAQDVGEAMRLKDAATFYKRNEPGIRKVKTLIVAKV